MGLIFVVASVHAWTFVQTNPWAEVLQMQSDGTTLANFTAPYPYPAATAHGAMAALDDTLYLFAEGAFWAFAPSTTRWRYVGSIPFEEWPTLIAAPAAGCLYAFAAGAALRYVPGGNWTTLATASVRELPLLWYTNGTGFAMFGGWDTFASDPVRTPLLRLVETPNGTAGVWSARSGSGNWTNHGHNPAWAVEATGGWRLYYYDTVKVLICTFAVWVGDPWWRVVRRYSEGQNGYQQVSGPPEARHPAWRASGSALAGQLLIGGYGYTVAGCDHGLTMDVWALDPTTLDWARRDSAFPACTDATAACLSCAPNVAMGRLGHRRMAAAAVVGDVVYVYGGRTEISGGRADLWVAPYTVGVDGPLCGISGVNSCGGGTCALTADGAHTVCVCPDRWTGTYCERCIAGWTGPACATAACGDCVHGMCNAPNTCTCDLGWNDTTCATPMCFAGCSGHGICTDPDACTCQGEWVGAACSHRTYTALITGLATGLALPAFIAVVCVATVLVVICYCRRPKVNVLDRVLSQEALVTMATLEIDIDMFKIDFDEIKVIRSVGSGGSSAIVFHVHWSDMDAAFKVFQIQDFHGKERFAEFEKEVSILASVSHDNVLGFYGACLNPPRVGIVMEYCARGSLHNYLHDNVAAGWQPMEERLAILRGIAYGMKYLHSRRILHRDLKPDNVLLTDNNTPRIMDFGLSRRVAADGQAAMTMAIGTAMYMAPELMLDDTYTMAVDVFAYGIVMFEVITQSRPYDQSTSVERRVAGDVTYRPTLAGKDKTAWADAPAQFMDVMRRTWSAEPTARPTFDALTNMAELFVPLDQ